MQRPFHDEVGYYEDRAAGLLASAQDGTPPAAQAFSRTGAPPTIEGARAVIAREHGFETWDELRAHVGSPAQLGDPFVVAYRAVERQDVAGLADVLEGSPHVVAACGTNGNDLLGMATATCDERLVTLLLERGADPSRANAHGWTARHQAAYRGLPHLVRLLLDAGADPAVRDAVHDSTPAGWAEHFGLGAAGDALRARGG